MPQPLPVKHIVGSAIGGVQRCILCAEIISDYRNAMVAEGSGPIPTWPEGAIYISGKNPTVFTTIEPEEGFTNCS